MRFRTALRIPKEHGAWGMLYVPLASGGLVVWEGGWRFLLLALSVTFVFIGREPLLALWRARSKGREAEGAARLLIMYLALAAICAAPLVLVWRLYGMLALGAAATGLLVWNAGQAAKREERTIPTELIGIAGLTLTAPAAYYTGVMRWDLTGLWLCLANALYFASSVFYVRYRVVAAHGADAAKLARVRSLCGFYHWGLAMIGVVVPFEGRALFYLAAAFAAVVLRAFYYLIRPAKTMVLRQIGRLEIVYSLVFLVFSVLAFRAAM